MLTFIDLCQPVFKIWDLRTLMGRTTYSLLYVVRITADYFNFSVHEYNKESSDPKEVVWIQKNM